MTEFTISGGYKDPNNETIHCAFQPVSKCSTSPADKTFKVPAIILLEIKGNSAIARIPKLSTINLNQ